MVRAIILYVRVKSKGIKWFNISQKPVSPPRKPNGFREGRIVAVRMEAEGLSGQRKVVCRVDQRVYVGVKI